jgi:hypothetical protein
MCSSFDVHLGKRPRCKSSHQRKKTFHFAGARQKNSQRSLNNRSGSALILCVHCSSIILSPGRSPGLSFLKLTHYPKAPATSRHNSPTIILEQAECVPLKIASAKDVRHREATGEQPLKLRDRDFVMFRHRLLASPLWTVGISPAGETQNDRQFLSKAAPIPGELSEECFFRQRSMR